jgi:hypothetical protein
MTGESKVAFKDTLLFIKATKQYVTITLTIVV